MSDDRESRAGGERANQSRTRDEQGLRRVAVLVIVGLHGAVAGSRFRYRTRSDEDIDDAMQDLAIKLLEDPETLLRGFDRARGTLEEYLANRVRRRVEDLRRMAQRRRKHEASVPLDDPLSRGRVATGIEDRAERLARRLTLDQREFVQLLLERRLSDSPVVRSPEALRQFVLRVRMKLREQDAEEADGKGEKKS